MSGGNNTSVRASIVVAEHRLGPTPAGHTYLVVDTGRGEKPIELHGFSVDADGNQNNIGLPIDPTDNLRFYDNVRFEEDPHTGGAEADLFIFREGDGDDTITDFDDGTDRILIAEDIGFDDLTVAANGNDAVILTGFSVADLAADDFLFGA